MKNTTYKVTMKSGRRFLVEELTAGSFAWTSSDTTKPNHKVAVVKELTGNLVSDEYKNKCYVFPVDSAIEYINALDALKLERIKSEVVQYLDK